MLVYHQFRVDRRPRDKLLDRYVKCRRNDKQRIETGLALTVFQPPHGTGRWSHPRPALLARSRCLRSRPGVQSQTPQPVSCASHGAYRRSRCTSLTQSAHGLRHKPLQLNAQPVSQPKNDEECWAAVGGCTEVSLVRERRLLLVSKQRAQYGVDRAWWSDRAYA